MRLVRGSRGRAAYRQHDRIAFAARERRRALPSLEFDPELLLAALGLRQQPTIALVTARLVTVLRVHVVVVVEAQHAVLAGPPATVTRIDAAVGGRRAVPPARRIHVLQART